MNVHRSFYRTVKNWKQHKCSSIGEWINYGILSHTTEHQTVLLKNKKKLPIHYSNMDESQKRYIEEKTPKAKQYIL